LQTLQSEAGIPVKESFLFSDAEQLVQNVNGFRMNSRKTSFQYIRQETTVSRSQFSSFCHMRERLSIGLAHFHSKIFMKWQKLNVPKICEAWLKATTRWDILVDNTKASSEICLWRTGVIRRLGRMTDFHPLEHGSTLRRNEGVGHLCHATTPSSDDRSHQAMGSGMQVQA
jgi:hypothetical protein